MPGANEHSLGSLPDSASIVIVGGGLAGLELAKELDRAGHPDVLVLEAGPADDLAHINAVNSPNKALRLWLEPNTDPYFWRPWVSKSVPHYDRTAGLRRRLGGRSLYWHGVTLPIEPWALCEPWWPKAVVHDLTRAWQGGASLYERVRADMDQWCAGYRRLDKELAPLSVGSFQFVPTPRAVREAECESQRWGAYTPAEHWADDSSRFTPRVGGVRVVSAAEVLGVKIDGRIVRGVIVRQDRAGPKEVSCAAAVLAAGTIENTRLAIQALHAAGVTSDDNLTGLVDHIVQGFVAFLAPAEAPEKIRALALKDAFYYSSNAGTRSNLFIRVYFNGVGAVVLDAWTMGEQLPSGEGVVQCVASGEWPWRVFVRAGLTRNDWDVVHGQRRELQNLWANLCDLVGRPVSTLEFPAFENPARMLENVLPELDITGPADQPVVWSGPLGSEYHEACTLPLGKIVDDGHQFVDVRGMYAVGPSIFPRPGAANPSMTSLALSKRLAGLLRV